MAPVRTRSSGISVNVQTLQQVVGSRSALPFPHVINRLPVLINFKFCLFLLFLLICFDYLVKVYFKNKVNNIFLIIYLLKIKINTHAGIFSASLLCCIKQVGNLLTDSLGACSISARGHYQLINKFYFKTVLYLLFSGLIFQFKLI